MTTLLIIIVSLIVGYLFGENQKKEIEKYGKKISDSLEKLIENDREKIRHLYKTQPIKDRKLN